MKQKQAFIIAVSSLALGGLACALSANPWPSQEKGQPSQHQPPAQPPGQPNAGGPSSPVGGHTPPNSPRPGPSPRGPLAPSASPRGPRYPTSHYHGDTCIPSRSYLWFNHAPDAYLYPDDYDNYNTNPGSSSDDYPPSLDNPAGAGAGNNPSGSSLSDEVSRILGPAPPLRRRRFRRAVSAGRQRSRLAGSKTFPDRGAI